MRGKPKASVCSPSCVQVTVLQFPHVLAGIRASTLEPWVVVWPFAGAALGLGDGLVGCNVVPGEALDQERQDDPEVLERSSTCALEPNCLVHTVESPVCSCVPLVK